MTVDLRGDSLQSRTDKQEMFQVSKRSYVSVSTEIQKYEYKNGMTNLGADTFSNVKTTSGAFCSGEAAFPSRMTVSPDKTCFTTAIPREGNTGRSAGVAGASRGVDMVVCGGESIFFI